MAENKRITQLSVEQAFEACRLRGEGLSARQVAKLMKCTVGAVYSATVILRAYVLSEEAAALLAYLEIDKSVNSISELILKAVDFYAEKTKMKSKARPGRETTYRLSLLERARKDYS